MPEIDKKCFASSRSEWRKWLEKNHKKEDSVWLIKKKRHTGKPSLSHRESMEEAICFGWIDTVVKSIDEDTYARRFIKRKNGGRWSRNTLSYAKEMIKQGRMAPAGLKTYKLGSKKPVINHDLPENPRTPSDLNRLLKTDKQANDFFKKLAPSYKKFFIWWIMKAKTEPTREKRVKEVFEKCKRGEKA